MHFLNHHAMVEATNWVFGGREIRKGRLGVGYIIIGCLEPGVVKLPNCCHMPNQNIPFYKVMVY